MIRYAIGLGSNLGDRLAYLRAAADGLDDLGSVTLSGVYESAPIGGPQQDPYLNAVAVLETELTPDYLLEALHVIEAQQKRERNVRWGARTLDLDIVATDGSAVSTEDLVIPHPRAAERRFVLAPLSEVWREADVGGGLTATRALEGLDDQGVDLLTTIWYPTSPRWPGIVYVMVQLLWFVAIAITLAADGSLPDGGFGVLTIVGGLMAIAGVGLALAASRQLGTALTAVPEPVRGAELVISGPFAKARHPLYGGVVLLMLGISLVLDSMIALGLSVGLVPFFYLKTEYEERQLRLKYAGYQEYRRAVIRRFVPFLF